MKRQAKGKRGGRPSTEFPSLLYAVFDSQTKTVSRAISIHHSPVSNTFCSWAPLVGYGISPLDILLLLYFPYHAAIIDSHKLTNWPLLHFINSV